MRKAVQAIATPRLSLYLDVPDILVRVDLREVRIRYTVNLVPQQTSKRSIEHIVAIVVKSGLPYRCDVYKYSMLP